MVMSILPSYGCFQDLQNPPRTTEKGSTAAPALPFWGDGVDAPVGISMCQSGGVEHTT